MAGALGINRRRAAGEFGLGAVEIPLCIIFFAIQVVSDQVARKQCDDDSKDGGGGYTGLFGAWVGY